MLLVKEEYKERIIDKKISKYLNIFGAISLEGPKWCGKTWTALNHANSVVYLHNAKSNFNEKKLAEMDVNLILDKEAPELIDEWQEVPAIWDAVRFKCDEDRKKGKYILTGSATPVTNDIHHSGAGRICRMKMRTMSLFEAGVSSGTVSLKDLFEGNVKNQLVNQTEIQDIIQLIIKGGWPESINMDEESALALTQSYIEDVLNFDMTNIDGVKRDINKMRRIMRSLARNESTLSSDSKIINDVNEEQDLATKNTVLDYIDVLQKLYLIENQNAFSTNLRSSSRVGKSAKRHFVDPSLVCGILGLTSKKLINDVNFLGFLFEALCERDLRTYIESYNGELYHFRDNTTGLEVDAIVEMSDGYYGAIEIKLGADKIEEAATNLKKFYDITKTKPKFMCIICGLYDAVIKRPDGIYILPITALKQ